MTKKEMKMLLYFEKQKSLALYSTKTGESMSDIINIKNSLLTKGYLETFEQKFGRIPMTYHRLTDSGKDLLGLIKDINLNL